MMDQHVALDQRVFKGWDAWAVRRGSLEIVLVPQIGGRIMGMLWRDEDLLFTQPEREGAVPGLDEHGVVGDQKRALGFPLWGGDKTWLAPQSAWNDGMPYLDLDSGPYDLEVLVREQDRIALSMTSQRCRETGLRLRRTIDVIAGRPDFVVRHEIENMTTSAVTTELWDVTMIMSPGIAFLPTWSSSSYPEGIKTYESEGESRRARATVVRTAPGYAAVDCRHQVAFKFGADSPAGWIAAVLEREDKKLVGYRKSVPVFIERSYAHGCVAEVYKSGAYPYLELELHGPTVTLQPEERFAMEERQWVADIAELPRSEAQVTAIGRG